MKKLSLLTATALLLFSLTACSTEKNTSSSKDESTEVPVKKKENTQKQEPTSHILKFGDSYIFTKKDFETTGYDSTGLKMTVKTPVIDENIDIKAGYSEEDYPKLEGKLPLVVTIEIENTTDNYIDMGGFKIIDSNGKDLKYSYAEGVSSYPVDGINGGQKLTITDVYLANDSKPITFIYETATWK